MTGSFVGRESQYIQLVSRFCTVNSLMDPGEGFSGFEPPLKNNVKGSIQSTKIFCENGLKLTGNAL